MYPTVQIYMLGLTSCAYSLYRTGTLTSRPHVVTLGRGDSAAADENAPEGVGTSVVDNPAGEVTTSERDLTCGTTVRNGGKIFRAGSAGTTAFPMSCAASAAPAACRSTLSFLLSIEPAAVLTTLCKIILDDVFSIPI